MKKILSLLLLAAFSATLHAAENEPYIVILKDNHDGREVARFHRAAPGRIYGHAVRGFSARLNPGQIRALERDTRVEVIEPDVEVTTQAQTIPPGVRRIGALSSTVARIDGVDERVNVDVAVLDTGVDASHPDLNVFRSVNFSTAASATDINGHGTHVAGIIGALDNTIGVVGVAPGARIWNVKVLGDNGNGLLSQVIAGLDYVAQNHLEIEVVNMSLGGGGYYESLRQAVLNVVGRGVVVVVAAGNTSFEVYGNDGIFGTEDDFWPASLPEVLTVSSMVDTDGISGGLGGSTITGADDTISSFSNFSRYFLAENPVTSTGGAIDLAAPGSSIYSTLPVAKGSYGTLSGTSMASPHVAGMVALYVTQHGRPYTYAGVVSVRQALIDMAQPQTSWGPAVTRTHLSNLPERLARINDSAGGPPEDGEAVNVPPAITIIGPAGGVTFSSGVHIEFTGTAIDYEDGNISAGMRWYSSIDGLFGTGAAVTYAGLSVGTHTIVAQATDSGGKIGQSMPRALTIRQSGTVIVPPSNTAPVVTITAPETGSSHVQGATINFTGTATDAEDGTITSNIQWLYNSALVATGSSYSTAALPVGSHTIAARITDSGNYTATTSVAVTVTPTNRPPTLSISSPSNGASYPAGTSIPFRATATDLEDGSLTAAIEWSSSVDGALGTGGSVNSTLTVGSHTITAAVEDNDGLTATATRTVSVYSVETPPSTPLVVTVTANKAFYRNREKAEIRALVTDGTLPVAGATVVFGIEQANGKFTYKTVTTTSAGVALFRFGIQTNKGGTGTYTVRANATRTGYEAGTGTTTFTVTN